MASSGAAAAHRPGGADDLAVLIQAFRCWNHWFLGDSAAARRDADAAIARARASGHTHSLCFALSFAAAMSWTDRDLEALTAYAGQGVQLRKCQGFPLWQGVNELFLAWAAAQRADLLRLLAVCEGRRGRHDELLHEASELVRRQGSRGLLTLRQGR